jgi:HAE1 family hydrophobic/amphiphilic exporter-1
LSLPALAVRRPVSVLMSLLALVVVGAITWRLIPVQLLPSGFSRPVMWVGIPTLPAAPADNERSIAEPVEDLLATMPDLESLRTIVRSDRVTFRVEMRANADSTTTYAQLRDRLDRAFPTLPEGTRQASIWRHNPNDDPVMIVGVTYPENARDAYETVRDALARTIERLPGASSVGIQGLSAREVHIEIDDRAARSAGVDTGALVRALQRDNFTMALGTLDAPGQRLRVRAVSRFEDLESIRALPIRDGLQLGEVARVAYWTDPEPPIHRVDGQPAVSLMIYKEASANTVAMTQQVQATLDATMAEDPRLKGYGARVFFDQGQYITRSIDQLQVSALYGGALAVLILLLFLRALGMTLLVTLAIPLCLLATILTLYFMGDSLNVLSMMGLMLSVGMVIDNAIVVLENIDRRRRMGQAARQAAVEGAHEVGLAITLATLTTLVVFLPMVLLGENPALAFYMGKIGFPVCYALLASLFVALVYIPSGACRIGPDRGVDAAAGERPLGPVMRRVQNGYARCLAWALRHRTLAFGIILLAIASTGIPFSKVQRVDQMQGAMDAIRINLYGPYNARQEELDQTTGRIEDDLLARKDELDIKAVVAHRGWSQNHVMVRVFFKGVEERTRPRDETIDTIRGLLPKRPGYRTRIGWQRGGGSNAGVLLHVKGPDTGVATELAEAIGKQLELLPAVDEARLEEPSSGTELVFGVRRDIADRQSLSALAIGGAIDYSLRGRRLNDFHTRTREIEMRVELAREQREEARQLERLAVGAPAEGAGAFRQPSMSDRGGTPLSLLTARRQAAGYGRIVRRDREARVSITVTGDEEALFGVLGPAVSRLSLPAGYSVAFGERFSSRRRNESDGGYAVLVAIVLVFFIMGVLFESFILPFSILLSIPLAFSGVFWTLYLTDTPMDIMSIIGCIILVGVVVNNGIVLIDQVQQRRAAGEPRDVALVEAARQRVRPILMTALTTIAGLIPMAFGSASLLGLEYHPLGRTVIGGLIAGTVLTLLAVPLFYALLDSASQLPYRLRLMRERLTSR